MKSGVKFFSPHVEADPHPPLLAALSERGPAILDKEEGGE